MPAVKVGPLQGGPEKVSK